MSQWDAREKAAAKFASAGFENCVVVDGGTQAWADAGLPVERGEHTVLPLDRQVQVAIGSIVLAGVLGKSGDSGNSSALSPIKRYTMVLGQHHGCIEGTTSYPKTSLISKRARVM